jgi:hypothetical protein
LNSTSLSKIRIRLHAFSLGTRLPLEQLGVTAPTSAGHPNLSCLLLLLRSSFDLKHAAAFKRSRCCCCGGGSVYCVGPPPRSILFWLSPNPSQTGRRSSACKLLHFFSPSLDRGGGGGKPKEGRKLKSHARRPCTYTHIHPNVFKDHLSRSGGQFDFALFFTNL